MGGIVGGLAGGLLGGVGGAQQDVTTTSLRLGPEGQLEQLLGGGGAGGLLSQFQGIQGLLGQGPGGQDVAAATSAQRQLAEQFRQASLTGGLPGQADISAAQGISQQLFAPQQLALQQSFEDQRTRAAQEAVRLGRPTTDPVLANLLARTQGRQTSLLGAQQGAQSQQIALGLPFQRLQLAQQGAGILGGLGSQAFQNRASVLGLGSGLLGAERQFRLQGAETRQTSGGGLGGAISGALGGIGAGLGAASLFTSGGLFGGGGGSQQQPGLSRPSLGNFQFQNTGFSGPTSFGFS